MSKQCAWAGWLTLASLALAACGNGDAAMGSNASGGSGSGGSGGSDAGDPNASLVASDGFITADPWLGSGFTATDPGAATITPDCSAGCNPPYVGNSFCMQGKVTGRPDYTGFAMLGWNVNQAPGTTDALTWPVPDSPTGGITVTVTNMPSTVALRIQLQGTDPHSGADRWCAALTNGKFMPWSSFKTNCWQGGTPQNALTPGTPIQQASVQVPGLLTDLPFNVCLTNLEITP